MIQRQLEWYPKDFFRIKMDGAISLEKIPEEFIENFKKNKGHAEDPELILTYLLYEPERTILLEQLDSLQVEIKTCQLFLKTEDANPAKRLLSWCNDTEWSRYTTAAHSDQLQLKNDMAKYGSEMLDSVPDDVMSRIKKLVSQAGDPEMLNTYHFDILINKYLYKLQSYIEHDINENVFDYYICSSK